MASKETMNDSDLNPHGKYSVIYADPPWLYNARNNLATRFKGGASGHYDLMTLDAIKALPVQNIIADSAVLFMWACFPKLKESLEVIEAWGFDYKTIGFIWIKLNPVNYFPFFGVGHYTKSNAEPCLLATRGATMKPATDTVSSVIMSPRRKHSQKPDEVRAAIEALYPNYRRIELFARERCDRWDAFGNEIESDVELVTK